MTKGTFGEGLKREREMRGVTLEEVSAGTRIATRFLQALEEEQWDQLPGGIFNRGFVRAVARYLGLDEESTVAEYALAVGDHQPVPVWTGTPPAVSSKLPWTAWLLLTVVILAVLVGAWFGARRLIAWRADRRPAVAAPLDTANPASSAQAVASGAPSNVVSDAAQQSAESDSPSSSSASAAISATDTPASGPTSPSDSLELKIEAAKKTKLTVVADDNRVFNGTIKPGEDHTFSAQDHFQISAKDAGALLLEMNGKTLAPIGPPGHSGKITLTRDALKEAAGGGN